MRPLLVGALGGDGVPQGGAGAELAAVGGVGGGPLAEVAAGALQGAPRAAAGRRARPGHQGEECRGTGGASDQTVL